MLEKTLAFGNDYGFNLEASTCDTKLTYKYTNDNFEMVNWQKNGIRCN